MNETSNLPPGVGGAETRTVWAQQVGVHFCVPYIDEFERLFGLQELDSFLASWGVDAARLRRDQGRWVSLVFLEALADELEDRTGSSEVIAHCGRLGMTKRYVGQLFPFMRMFASPGQIYHGLPRLSGSVNKVNTVEVESMGRGAARIRYLPGEPRERSRNVCIARRAQLGVVPAVWGLPDAEVTELSCLHDGDDDCTYELRWRERVRWVFTLAAAGLGLGLAAVTTLGWLAPWSAGLMSAVALLGGILLDSRKRLAEAERYAGEQQQSLTTLLASLEAQFLELSDEMERRRAVERRQVALLEQLHQSQKMETVGLLAGGIAHDFNNLLTVINSYAGFVLEDVEPGSGAAEDLQAVIEAGDRAAGLTRQLLAFSRKQVLESHDMELDQVVAGLEPMLRRIIGEDVELILELQAPACTVFADPGQVEQVLMNLAVNARDAMPAGGRLQLRTEQVELGPQDLAQVPELKPGSWLVLAIQDSGVGMEPAVVERAFEPFYTTKVRGRGTGLGLATVYGIVQQSGGFLRVESEPGQGSTFEVLLPRVDPVRPGVAPVEPERTLRGNEVVLLVEDEGAVRALSQRILERAGYRVVPADGPSRALEIWAERADRIDVLLSDVVMPGMSGKALADRCHATRADLPVLFMSGYTQDAIARHGVLERGTHLLHKPFEPRELLSKLREVLDDSSRTE